MVYSHWLGPEPGQGLGQGPGRASINQWKHFQDLKNGYQTHSSGPENVPSVLIKKILPGPGPDSGPSQCEYTLRLIEVRFEEGGRKESVETLLLSATVVGGR